jgi:hypothetical protein
VTRNDLRWLGVLAARDRESLFRRMPEIARLYSRGAFAVALCQGAALHFINGKNGIKDFDVWTFYWAKRERPFPYRRRGVADFGDSKFGTTDDKPLFVGRRVDFMGRSLHSLSFTDPVAVLRHYLRFPIRQTLCAKAGTRTVDH